MIGNTKLEKRTVVPTHMVLGLRFYGRCVLIGLQEIQLYQWFVDGR